MEFGVLIGTEEFEFQHVADLGIHTIQAYIRCKDDELTEEHFLMLFFHDIIFFGR